MQDCTPLGLGAFQTCKPFLQTHSKGTALFIQTEDLDYGRGHVTRSQCFFFFIHLSPVLLCKEWERSHLGDTSNPKQRKVQFYYRVILSSRVQWLLGNSATVQFTVHSLCGLNKEPLGLLFNHYTNTSLRILKSTYKRYLFIKHMRWYWFREIWNY